MGGDASEAAVGVIAEHTPDFAGGCSCGSPVGGTHPYAAHVLHQLQLVGIDVVWR